MVMYKRRQILIDNISLLRKSFEITKKYCTFEIISINIMKDHLHLLLSTQNPSEIPQIIRTIKQNFTKLVPKQYHPQNITLSMQKRSEKGIWQRRYYDHIIRNENDLYKHIDYIHYNSMKHYQIAPKDWEYSSFRKFVKLGYYDANWCNFEDKHCINSINCE